MYLVRIYFGSFCFSVLFTLNLMLKWLYRLVLTAFDSGSSLEIHVFTFFSICLDFEIRVKNVILELVWNVLR